MVSETCLPFRGHGQEDRCSHGGARPDPTGVLGKLPEDAAPGEPWTPLPPGPLLSEWPFKPGGV